VFDDNATHTITSDEIRHRHKVSPYVGETLRGQVHATYLRGEKIASGDTSFATDHGALL
jgi:allantoinase